MARTARGRRTRVRRTATATPVLPEELVLWEILLRLPAKDILRCRAVCRSWCRLTSAADFLLAHHRRQPSLPLVCFRGRTKHVTGCVDEAFDAFDLRRSPAERRPVLRFNGYRGNRPSPYRVHASCDGLIVVSLSTDRFFYICNPITRQWISLPNLTCSRVLGLYPHSSSGEYRILYKTGRQLNSDNPFYILIVGSSMAPRNIGKFQLNKQWLTKGSCILLYGCLHWLHYYEEKVLVFDTIGESFRWMCGASASTVGNNKAESHLVQMDGTLGISRVCENRIKVWMLHNYEAEVWLLKYQFELSVVEMRSIANTLYFYGMVLCENGDMLVYCYTNLFHYDNTGKLLQKFQWDDVLSWPTGGWFKESLIQHAFFQRKDGYCARKPRFFQGL